MPSIWQLVDSSTIGGIERHIEILAGGLREAGHDCEVVFYERHGDNPWRRQLEAADIPFRILDGTASGLTRAIGASRPRLVHTHGYKAGILGRAAARLSNVPVVSTFHSGERGAFPVSLYQTIDELSAFLAPAIAVSDPIRARLPAGAALIRNFVRMPTATTSIVRERLRIGFVGRFSHEKGPDRFCALADIMEAVHGFEAVTWHAYGDGPMLRSLDTEAHRNVHFHGLQTDMSAIWPRLDLLVIPSRAEGLPLSALEALSHGIPVIAPRIGALPDAIEHEKTGWLFDAGNLEEAADFIAAWARMDLAGRMTMFRACRQSVEEKFSLEARLQDILAVYEKSGLEKATNGIDSDIPGISRVRTLYSHRTRAATMHKAAK